MIPVNFAPGVSAGTAEAASIEPYVADFGDGPIRVAPAGGIIGGLLSREGGGKMVMLTLYGRSAPFGLCQSLSVDDARDLARVLAAMADTIEQEAALAAKAALNKAAGR